MEWILILGWIMIGFNVFWDRWFWVVNGLISGYGLLIGGLPWV